MFTYVSARRSYTDHRFCFFSFLVQQHQIALDQQMLEHAAKAEEEERQREMERAYRFLEGKQVIRDVFYSPMFFCCVVYVIAM